MTDSRIVIRSARSGALAHEWELVLLAQGFAPSVHVSDGRFLLSVPADQQEGAAAALDAYGEENRAPVPAQAGAAPPMDLNAGALAGLILLLAYAGTAVIWRSEPWLDYGSANAGDILDGEVWRCVTALLLHGDIAHVLGNAVALAVFYGAVSGQLGAGIGAAAVLGSGALGNLLNACLQGPPHDSVGASTAVFGAVGITGSLALVLRRRSPHGRRRAWLTVAAGLALLGMLGAGGGRVDVLAHFFGFICGTAAGAGLGAMLPERPGLSAQWFWGAATGAVIAGSWYLALAS